MMLSSANLKFLLLFLLGISFRESLAKEREEDLQAQANTIDPSQVTQLSWHPRVFLYSGFLSAEECDHLIYTVHPKSNIIINADESSRNSTKRMLFDLSILHDTKDEISRRIEERISAWTFLPLDNSNGLQVVHFGVENSEKDHHYFDTRYVKQAGKTLLATVILYLSDSSQGGQLIFPQSQNEALSGCAKTSDIVQPKRGNAIVFFNLNLNATLDGSSSHGRCPVLEGEMWGAIKMFYVKEKKNEKNVVAASNESDDCRDEDDKCFSWASAGECSNNPVFMIGSNDYYGTCRKSCNACAL